MRAVTNKTRINDPVDKPLCRCPDCGAIHWERKGGRKASDPVRDRAIYRLYSRKRAPLSQQELADKFGISRPRVQAILLEQKGRALAREVGKHVSRRDSRVG